MFFHLNEKDSAEIDYILLSKNATRRLPVLLVENYNDSNVSDHIPVYKFLKIRIVKKNLKPVTVISSPNGISVMKHHMNNASSNR